MSPCEGGSVPANLPEIDSMRMYVVVSQSVRERKALAYGLHRSYITMIHLISNAVKPMTLNLNELLENSRSGVEKAEEKLIQHLRVRFLGFSVLRLGNCQDAEEAVQDALTAIMREYRSITFDVSFAAWAYKVLNNRILKKLNSRQRRESNMSKSDSVEHLPDLSDSAETAELRIKLANCLRKIGRVNKRYARILNLHYLGYATTEISDKLNITTENFYMILSRARSMLKQCLNTGTIE